MCATLALEWGRIACTDDGLIRENRELTFSGNNLVTIGLSRRRRTAPIASCILKRSKTSPLLGKIRAILGVAAVSAVLASVLPSPTQTAVANGDTRTISLIHAHTKETITATFRQNGSYDQATLDRLNWFLRDWRHDEPTKMDPQLFDVIWEAYRQSGSREPIMVMSAYRSPATNAMLRRHSRAVAEHSQHILGRAMDQHYLDVSAATVREIAMKMQRGGVGYYPTAGSPFVHMDVGGVRSWPRMSYDQLARLFPDGKTVHIPSNGQPMARYEEARAEIEASGSRYVPVSSVGKSKSFFAALFGGADEDEDGGAVAPSLARGRRQAGQRIQVASVASGSSDKDDSRTFFAQPPQSAPAVDAVATPSPASSKRVRPAPAVEPKAVAAPAPAPAPAVLEAKPQPAVPEPAPRPEVPSAAPEPDEAPVAVAALPTPPRRPAALIALLSGANVPTPPPRPVTLNAFAAAPSAKPDQIASLIAAPSNSDAAGALPEVITRGLTLTKPTPIGALGYAAESAPNSGIRPSIGPRPAAAFASLGSDAAPAKPVAAAAVKIDRAGLRVATSPQLASRVATATALGVAAPPLRASIRSQTASLFGEPLAGMASGFSAAPVFLPTDHFTAVE